MSKEFIKNTLILFVGKFSTQFSTFLLLPLFTHFLLSDDYGLVDLLQTYITLFVPILTLRMDSVMFRYLIDKRNDLTGEKKIISNVLFVSLICIFITILLSIILFLIVKIKYFVLTVFSLLMLMLSSILLQILRGMGKNKEYSIASIMASFITLFVNIILIFNNFGAGCILISIILSNLVVSIYVIFSIKLFSYLNLKLIDKNYIKEMLCYSLPMIPNSLSWWIVNASDRTLITIFLNVSMNGIYSVSCKFSNLLSNIYSVFNISWQEMASLYVNDKNKDDLFSKMIMKIFTLFACLSLVINSFIPLFYNILIGNEYIASYNYIPILLYANIWNVMISLFGGVYIALKETKKIAITTLLSAAINILINISLIKKLGLYASALSTLIAYLSMTIYRYYDLKKVINLNLNLNKIVYFTFIYVFITLLYYINNVYLNIISIIISVTYSLYENKEFINELKQIILNKVKHAKN